MQWRRQSSFRNSLKAEENKIFKKIILIIAAIVIVALAAFVFYTRKDVYTPLDSKNSEAKIVVVRDGESTPGIGDDLEDFGIIKSSMAFQFYVKYRHLSLVPGAYKFSPDMSITTIAGKISRGEISYNKILFQEGLRREQMAQVLNKNGYTDYKQFMLKTEGMEGKLFPDTYYFPLDSSMDYIVEKIKTNFAERTIGLTLKDSTIILASIIEREAGNDDDRSIIAGVFQNRLDAGMMLQSDPTALYQKDTNNYRLESLLDYKFWNELLPSEIRGSRGTFNTYLNVGLPKGSISNPGLASIRAAIDPAKHDYYYFLYGNDNKIHLAKTSAEHETNIDQYLR